MKYIITRAHTVRVQQRQNIIKRKEGNLRKSMKKVDGKRSKFFFGREQVRFLTEERKKGSSLGLKKKNQDRGDKEKIGTIGLTTAIFFS